MGCVTISIGEVSIVKVPLFTDEWQPNLKNAWDYNFIKITSKHAFDEQ